MAALPYIQLYIADYLADTAHLTTIQHGAYLLLIFNYWQRGRSLPNDDLKLSSIAKMSLEVWLQNKDVLLEFFDLTDENNLIHYRIERDLEKVGKNQNKKIKAGKASASARKKKAISIPCDNSTDAQQMFNTCSTDVQRVLIYTDTDTDTDTDTESSFPKNKFLEKKLFKKNLTKKSLEDFPEAFLEFWEIYPKQRAGSREKAFQAWKKAVERMKGDVGAIHSGCVSYAKSSEVSEGYAKGCAAWLNDDRFKNNYDVEIKNHAAKPSLTEQYQQAFLDFQVLEQGKFIDGVCQELGADKNGGELLGGVSARLLD